MAVLFSVIRGVAGVAPFATTCAVALWALSTNPLSAPLIERTGEDLVLSLERSVRIAATAEWVAASLEAAVAEEDAERAAMLLGLADDLGHVVDRAPAAALIAEAEGWTASAAACVACMADAMSCPSVAMLGACAVPFEMSPLGDVNALRRQAMNWATDVEVDEVEAGLATLGLAATAGILVSGGSSVTVKAGASLLRLGRRIGAVTPELARMLRVPVRWDGVPGVVTGRIGIGEITDTAKLTSLGAVAADLQRVRRATSTGEALRLTRLIDTPEDARHVARIAEAMGPRTTRTFAVLGKSRTLRAGMRVSRVAVAAMVAVWLAVLQLALVIATRIGTASVRAGLRLFSAPPPRREPVLTRTA
ncbi:hypothetical protein [uncultured Jannaschia sp.]|uniref:hypothetical protein n=1 Tax=uncultured Jannaschia sp. TaxID=293347 RepID=UPI0026256A81|nr:hypothetical protein [uncultured Jannaschia sp.]